MECEEWLSNLLHEEGTVLFSTVKIKAREAGFTRGQLKAARRALRVVTINDWAANGETMNWFWQLPRSEG